MNPQVPISNTLDEDLDDPATTPLGDVRTSANFAAVSSDSNQGTPDTNPVLQNAPLETEQVEMAWVDKAKNILQNYLADPYVMTKEIEKLRVDYMKNQHGKIIKSNEDQAGH